VSAVLEFRSGVAAAGAAAARAVAVVAAPPAPGADREWDAYVRRSPAAGFFHLAGWRRTVLRTFGHRAHYLTARHGGRIAGILPLFELRSALFGRSLVSLPFAIGGGAAADGPEAAAALLAAARALAEERRVDYLELRSERPLPAATAPGLLTKDLYVTFRADLREGEEALLRRMERKRRQMMSYAARAGFTWRVAGAEELPLFHRLFAQNMHHHGTPVYPRRFLARLLGEHPAETNLFFVEQDGRPLAGVLNLLFKGVLMPFYAGHELPRRGAPRPRGVDDYLYLALMRWGREQGFHTFDFGRSKRGTGAYQFKARWGMEEVPLGYQYHLVRARELPNVSPANPKYSRLIAAWKRLPLAVAMLLGPSIVKRVP
jgi:FemAB-related protein (PEP-CTERM system-associated)